MSETIEALGAQLKTTLDRETATTARFDARIVELEAENARLRKALQPFADVAIQYDAAAIKLGRDPRPDDYVPLLPTFSYAAFRRAREELKKQV